MGKHGPCCHCGVTSTPLWRNGPPDKPVLCNACGSRWRTKGSLTNYTPMHSREFLDSEESKVSKIRNLSGCKEQRRHERRARGLVEHETPYSGQNFHRVMEETSNRSISGSAISCSESCARISVVDVSDFTVSAQSNMWESLVPSRKRTCVIRTKPPSSIETLTKDLYSIWHEQQSSCLSDSSQEDLLLNSENRFGSFDIGHGGVLLSSQSSKAMEDESEASSFPIDNKLCGVFIDREGLRASNDTTAKRCKPSCESVNILQDRASPLCYVDLEDIINFETFRTYLTHDEQKKLMKYLPCADASNFQSLKNMLESPHFVESLLSYQRLLKDGVFDLSIRGLSSEKCKSLKSLVLFDFSKVCWVESYYKIKDIERKMEGNGEPSDPNIVGYHSNFASSYSISGDQIQKLQEAKGSLRSPRNASYSCTSIARMADMIDSEGDGGGGGSFSPRSLFASPSDVDASQILLPEMSSVSPFSDSELLFDPLEKKVASNALAVECGISEESLSGFFTLSASSSHLPGNV